MAFWRACTHYVTALSPFRIYACYPTRSADNPDSSTRSAKRLNNGAKKHSTTLPMPIGGQDAQDEPSASKPADDRPYDVCFGLVSAASLTSASQELSA